MVSVFSSNCQISGFAKGWGLQTKHQQKIFIIRGILKRYD